MTWKTETDAQNLLDLAGRLRNFLCGYKLNALPGFTGSGSGSLDAFGAAPAVADQTFTITCTDATTEGAEVWSVSGSVSGALANAVSNTLYENGGVTFIISTDAVTPFAVTDAFTVVVSGAGPMTTSGEAATLQQHSYSYAGTALSEYHFQVEFSGAGTDTINLGHVAARDIDNNRFYVELYGAPTYNAGLGVFEQPGGSPKRVIYTRNQPMTHWMVADDYGYKWAIIAGTTFRLAYARFLVPYASPNQYPFPLAIGGESDDAGATNTFSTQSSLVRFCVDPAYRSLTVNNPANGWENVYNYANNATESFVTSEDLVSRVWPYGYTRYVRAAQDALMPNLDGEYCLLPIIVTSALAQESYGEFEGLFAVSGFNTLTAGDVVQYLGDDYLIVQNIHRNQNYDYVAMRLT